VGFGRRRGDEAPRDGRNSADGVRAARLHPGRGCRAPAIIAADWTRREDARAAALEAIHARAGRRRGLLLWELDREDVERPVAEEVAGDWSVWCARGRPSAP